MDRADDSEVGEQVTHWQVDERFNRTHTQFEANVLDFVEEGFEYRDEVDGANGDGYVDPEVYFAGM